MQTQNSLERHGKKVHIVPGDHTVSEDAFEVETAIDLLVYWRIIYERRWTVFVVFLVFFTFVLIGTLRQTPIYRASLLMEIRKENPEVEAVQDMFDIQGVSDTYLRTQFKILESERLANRVIDQLRLGILEEFDPPKGWFSSRKSKKGKSSEPQIFVVGEQGFERDPGRGQIVMERFKDRLKINPVKRSRLVEITFESQDSALAAQIVNTLASNYIEWNLESHWEATQKASEWLSQQLIGLQRNLEKSEDELQRYARMNGLLFLETEGGGQENIVNQRLRQLQVELTKVQGLRYEKEALYQLIEAGDYGSLPGVFESRLMQDLMTSLAELEVERALLETKYTSNYPKVKEVQNQIREIERVLTREQERVTRRITKDYQAAARREGMLWAAFESQQEEANLIASKSVQYNILKREVETNRQIYEGFLQRLKEAGVSSGLKSNNIRIVDAARTPDEPFKPRVLFNLMLGTVFGLFLGVGTAFLQDHLDNTMKNSSDVERFLQLPSLAIVPSLEQRNGHPRRILGAHGVGKIFEGETKYSVEEEVSDPAGPASEWFRIDSEDGHRSSLGEAFRGLRTSILLSSAEHAPRSLLVTSSSPTEGKTTISVNLAISLADLGERVLLIDSDMRRPSIHKVFPSINFNGGLSSYLAGQKNWKEVIQSTSSNNLDVLSCGALPPNPSELLFSERMRTLLHETVANYRFVVIDSPPILNLADSRILSTLVDSVILVVKGGFTSRESVQRSILQLRQVGSNLIGVVLNNIHTNPTDYYAYYYKSIVDDHPEQS